MERWYLKALEYNVSVPGAVYAKYFFELREMINDPKKRWKDGKKISTTQEKRLSMYSTNPSMASGSVSKNNGSRSLIYSAQPEMKKNRSDSNLLQLETILSTSELIKI